jgi:hypothetical protein
MCRVGREVWRGREDGRGFCISYLEMQVFYIRGGKITFHFGKLSGNPVERIVRVL